MIFLILTALVVLGLGTMMLNGTVWGCQFFGWHVPDQHYTFSDSFNSVSVCKFCGCRIMQDSQGNWFEVRNG